MSFKEEFKSIIKELELMHPEEDSSKLWKEEVELLTRDMKESIDYLRNECTASEFSWMSEVFSDIMKENPSKEFIEVLYELAKKYPEETEKYNILSFIEEAEMYLPNNHS